MRPRSVLVAVLVVLAATLVALASALWPSGHSHHRNQPPAATAAMPRGLDLKPYDEEFSAGWVGEVMPMHQAVRLAMQRFDGKVLDIALIAAGSDAPDGSPLTYHIRILTRSRDVLDIRMDAFTGRFLELRGANVAAARRKPNEKD